MLQSLFLSDDCSTCFGYHYHPSSGAQTTVTITSGNHYTVLLSVTIVEELEILYKNIITKHGPMNVKINLHSGVLLVVFVIIS